MISIVDGAARAHTIRSLRAACELLSGAADGVNAVSVSGHLPEGDDPAMPILSLAQGLAAERGLAVHVEVDGDRFIVQFRRGTQPAARPASEAG
ncbi:MAG TPA: hypothetical protein VF153_03575 [Candidatus Limnocylindria bacterium]